MLFELLAGLFLFQIGKMVPVNGLNLGFRRLGLGLGGDLRALDYDALGDDDALGRSGETVGQFGRDGAFGGLLGLGRLGDGTRLSDGPLLHVLLSDGPLLRTLLGSDNRRGHRLLSEPNVLSKHFLLCLLGGDGNGFGLTILNGRFLFRKN